MFNDKKILINIFNKFNIFYIDTKCNFICFYIGINSNLLINKFKENNILVKCLNNKSNFILNGFVRLSLQANYNNIIEKLLSDNNLNIEISKSLSINLLFLYILNKYFFSFIYI